MILLFVLSRYREREITSFRSSTNIDSSLFDCEGILEEYSNITNIHYPIISLIAKIRYLKLNNKDEESEKYVIKKIWIKSDEYKPKYLLKVRNILL